MFPYWFMTAFSIIRMDWQVDSMCPDLPILLMVFDTYSTLMDVWSIVSILPIWCLPLPVQCHCPSPWDQPWLQCLLSVSQFPRLNMEDNESAFNTKRWDMAGSLWDTSNGFWLLIVTCNPVTVRKYQSYHRVSLEADIPWWQLKMTQKHSGNLS